VEVGRAPIVGVGKSQVADDLTSSGHLGREVVGKPVDQVTPNAFSQ
jgi:hypothetical protein